VDAGSVAGRITGAAVTGESAAHDVIDAIGDARVVPVVTVDDARDAPHLASALVDGGLPVVEITLRTPAAIDAIRRATAQVPGALVGAGSVTSAAAADDAIDAGARFIVSPGLHEGVVAAAGRRGVAVIPGIATATELMRAVNLGAEVVKLFPAEVVGGVGMITALSAVWPDVRFMPTGGISATNAREYLAVRQVLAIGGSWMVPRSAVASGDWASITVAAAAAVMLARDSA
jgi:2-dehydro-3-deoxyphosphogluconate aldolase / (4S)-4-hydroxy-2-oxoglutarate aldolase